jgi:hypothetical protein
VPGAPGRRGHAGRLRHWDESRRFFCSCGMGGDALIDYLAVACHRGIGPFVNVDRAGARSTCV